MEFDIHSQNSAHEDARGPLEEVQKRYGFIPNLLGVMANSPALLKAYQSVQALFEATDFTPAERQIVLLAASKVIGDYGLTAGLYAHQYQDPWTSQHMKRNAPAVVDYVSRCEFPTAPLQGEFLPDDELPETLLPILRRMMSEQMPHVSATVTAIEAWAGL